MSVSDDQAWVLQRIRRVLTVEAEHISTLAGAVDEAWADAVRAIVDCGGKVAVLALGKSGHVAKKVAATMASLGTPAFFLHAAEAALGDLGTLREHDVVLAISHSGETSEVVDLLPAIREVGCTIVALTSRRDSRLGRGADISLILSVDTEADHLGLAPTSSSTLALAAGDALAVAAAEVRGFDREAFAFRHPGGPLGRKAREPEAGPPEGS